MTTEAGKLLLKKLDKILIGIAALVIDIDPKHSSEVLSLILEARTSLTEDIATIENEATKLENKSD